MFKNCPIPKTRLIIKDLINCPISGWQVWVHGPLGVTSMSTVWAGKASHVLSKPQGGGFDDTGHEKYLPGLYEFKSILYKC